VVAVVAATPEVTSIAAFTIALISISTFGIGSPLLVAHPLMSRSRSAAGSEAVGDGKLICGGLQRAGGGYDPADQPEDFQGTHALARRLTR
jgi:hypothetical protein